MSNVARDFVALSPAEFVDDRLEDENRTGGAEYSQRLAGEEAVSDATDETGNQRFHGGHVLAGRLAKEAAERDDRRQASKVQEDERCHALKRQGVLKVGQVERGFPLHVVDQPAEQSAGSLETGLLPELLLVRFLVELLLGLLLLRPLPDFLSAEANEDSNIFERV